MYSLPVGMAPTTTSPRTTTRSWRGTRGAFSTRDAIDSRPQAAEGSPWSVAGVYADTPLKQQSSPRGRHVLSRAVGRSGALLLALLRRGIRRSSSSLTHYLTCAFPAQERVPVDDGAIPGLQPQGGAASQGAAREGGAHGSVFARGCVGALVSDRSQSFKMLFGMLVAVGSAVGRRVSWVRPLGQRCIIRKALAAVVAVGRGTFRRNLNPLEQRRCIT